MTAESNEQFHYSHSIETTLARYFGGIWAEREGLGDVEARESIYMQSLSSMYDMVNKLQPDPYLSDEIMRGVMPSRFDEQHDLDVNLWLTELQLVPTKLIQRGDIAIDREDISVRFFDDLMGWTVANSRGHDVGCAMASECVHDIATHRERCPIRETGFTLMAEIRLLYCKLHGEYQAYFLAHKVDSMKERAEAIGQLFVKYGLASEDDLQAFLLRAENDAVIYASKVNGLDSFDDSPDE